MLKKIKFFLLFFLLVENTSHAIINSKVLSKYEIKEFVESKIKEDLKINKIGYSINESLVNFCKKKTINLGLLLVSKEDIKKKLSSTSNNFMSFGNVVKNNIYAYEEIIGELNGLKIIGVIENSQSFKNKLKKGDTIIEVNNTKINSVSTLNQKLKTLIKKKENEIKFKIKRKDLIFDVKFKNELMCDINYEVIKTIDKELIFFRSTNTIYISDELLSYFKNDDELAMLLSNEFSHFINGHNSIKPTFFKLKKSFLFADFWKPFAGFLVSGAKSAIDTLDKIAFRYSEKEEGLADFSSIKILGILGYNSQKAKLFWERIVEKKPNKNYVSKFRPVDSRKIRIINYAIDDKDKTFPTLEKYLNFIEKYKI